jgi:hypothetical protein
MRNCCGCVRETVADAYVVDTGVFLRWFIDQDGFEHARGLQQRLIDGAVTAETVDFARVEVAGSCGRRASWRAVLLWMSSLRRSVSSTISA